MRTLLIVDDQEGVLHSLHFVFSERGYRTVVAKSGPAALALASAEKLDAGLVDLHMPGMDGVTVCSSLRAAGQTLPLWIMTAACAREAESKAREIGVIAVLRKPFDIDEFTSALEAHWAALPSVVAVVSTQPAGTEHAA